MKIFELSLATYPGSDRFSGGCSDRALGLAEWLAKQHGTEVTLLHVSELANGLMLDTTVHPAGYAEPVSVECYLTSHAVVRMNEQAKRVLGKLVASRVAFGPTAVTIAEVAKQERSDLVVMGTDGRIGLSAPAAGQRGRARGAGGPLPGDGRR